MTTITDYTKVHCQSPILTVDRVDCTQYSLRLSPYTKYGLKETEELLSNFQDWIYSVEVSKAGKEHYHVVIWSPLDEESVRIKIRSFLSLYFPGPSKRGDANKQYNLSEVEDLELVVTYLLKDSGVIKYSQNIDPDKITQLQKKSYKKFSKEEFQKQLEELKKRFKTDSPRIGEMMESVVRLKAIYRQPVNMTQIYQMCVSYEVHNDPTKSTYYVQEFLSRFN